MDNNTKRSGNTKNSGSDSSRQKSSEVQATKNFPKNSRRREIPQTIANNNNNSKQHQSSAKVRPNVDKRPRARGYNGNNNGFGVSLNDYLASSSARLVAEDSTTNAPSGEGAIGHESNRNFELNSVHSTGCKKQNLNHLLNFYYTSREVDYYEGAGGGAGGAYGQRHVKKHKYNKEQFLQANFQFVIKASAKRKTNDSPDTLIDWSLIEQINIQTPDEPQCPICLFPPVAAKVTRCGHVYCWPCVLHYLSLSDKSWRKCPICYDAVHVGDLKSASIVQQKSFSVGLQITFRLMRRKKGSLLIEKFESWKSDDNIEKYPYVSSPTEDKLFSKFILAKRSDIIDIMAREREELLINVDESCPEFVFVQQAIELLKERSEKLGDVDIKEDENTVLLKEAKTQHDDKNKLYSDTLDNTTNSTSEENEKKEPIQSITEETLADDPAAKPSLSLGKYYYFYQADDGQNVYLHPLNVKMLQASYGSLADAPPLLTARILQKEQHSMDDEHRRKFTCLGHLPLTCQFSVVEVDLQPPYVSEDVIRCFKADIIHRKKERQRRAREEREREKHINAINDRQMGKLISSAANINITSSHEFPTCGFEEPLPSAEQVDNVPSTSNGTRKKTVSSSSSCSYSSIATHGQQEYGPWKTIKKLPNAAAAAVMLQSQQNDDTSILNSIQTNLGEVLAQALSQKKSSDKTSVGSKKTKKSKKMLPLYSTGMNFSK